MDAKASARFGDSQNLPDLTSVHCAVSKRMCNLHIDEMGFVVTDAKGTIIVDPDALRHIFGELLWKADLQGKLPFWALDHVSSLSRVRQMTFPASESSLSCRSSGD